MLILDPLLLHLTERTSPHSGTSSGSGLLHSTLGSLQVGKMGLSNFREGIAHEGRQIWGGAPSHVSRVTF